MWLVIGYGSLLHGDDRLGVVVADQVRTLAAARNMPDIDVLTGNQLMPEWAEPLSRADGAIFIDASAELPAGEYLCTPLHPTSPAEGSSIFSHYPTPQSLLDSARTLYGHAPTSWLYAVGGADFTLSEALSPKVEKAILPLIEAILITVAAH